MLKKNYLNRPRDFQYLVKAVERRMMAKMKITDTLAQIQHQQALRRPGPLYQGGAVSLPSDRKKKAAIAILKSKNSVK